MTNQISLGCNDIFQQVKILPWTHKTQPLKCLVNLALMLFFYYPLLFICMSLYCK
ncbi:protein of unknown function [Legionella micdadei]|uniref:Uncharacterized protein n=1 Tax=Legionella micdadei TaxID=451 RepID=A0A098GGA0_LEGMI|nr:protein of unknown function [Legionella micdadei]